MAAFSPTEHEREDIISSLKTYNQQITTVIDKANDDVIPSLNKVELKSAEIELHSILFQSIPYLVTCYRSMGIKTSKDFYTHPTIVQSKEVENLMKIMGTLTDRYHEALRNVDDVLSHESTKEANLKDIILNDVLTKEELSLESILQRSRYTLLVLLRHFA